MIKQTFSFVANSLSVIGRRTGLTYNEVNILVYYLLIPLSWGAMVDIWLGVPIISLALLLVWLGIWRLGQDTYLENGVTSFFIAQLICLTGLIGGVAIMFSIP